MLVFFSIETRQKKAECILLIIIEKWRSAKTDICNYADYNTPFAYDMNLEMLVTKLECAIDNAFDCFRSNGMKLNLSKCKLIVSGREFENMVCKIENSQLLRLTQLNFWVFKLIPS